MKFARLHELNRNEQRVLELIVYLDYVAALARYADAVFKTTEVQDAFMPDRPRVG